MHLDRQARNYSFCSHPIAFQLAPQSDSFIDQKLQVFPTGAMVVDCHPRAMPAMHGGISWPAMPDSCKRSMISVLRSFIDASVNNNSR